MLAQHTRLQFRRAYQIIPVTVPSTTAGVVDVIGSTMGFGENFDLTIHCSTGTLYFNNTTAVTAGTGFKLNQDQSIDLKVKTNVSIIGATTLAAYQAIIWE
jgi:hypothetical protein